jgi:hypothetical protein
MANLTLIDERTANIQSSIGRNETHPDTSSLILLIAARAWTSFECDIFA